MHKWTDQECEIVCRVFKDEFVNSNNSTSFTFIFVIDDGIIIEDKH